VLTDDCLAEIFKASSFEEALSKLQNYAQLIESYRPYGLSYGDVYHIIDCFYSIGLRGYNVLEFGGSLNGEFIERFIQPESWHSVTLDLYDQDYHYDANYLFRPGVRVQSFSSNITSSNLGLQNVFIMSRAVLAKPGYQRVFSVAAFEHLQQPLLCMQQLYSLCDDHALVYAFFTPVWSAPNGHHWSNYPKPLPDFVHLLNTHEEFVYKSVHEDGISKIDAEMHGHYIYKSTRINRLLPVEWNSLFNDSPFETQSLLTISEAKITDMPLSVDEKKRLMDCLRSDTVCYGYRYIGKR
jgi:hypothetical protein